MREGVENKGMKQDVFLRQLAIHLTLSDRVAWVEPENIWYLGAGYWRVKKDDTGEPFFWLINPDRTYPEIDLIEKAMNILL